MEGKDLNPDREKRKDLDRLRESRFGEKPRLGILRATGGKDLTSLRPKEP